MTIEQIKYLLAIVETGSFNQAAKKIFVSQPSLSIAIKSLESQLGFQIFERNKSGVILTDKGKELVAYAEKIVENINLIEEIKSVPQLAINRLSISSQAIFSILDPFSKLIRKYMDGPGEFQFMQSPFFEVVHNVKEGLSNFGFVYVMEENSKILSYIFEDNALDFTPLTTVKQCFTISQRHPLFDSAAITPDDLLSYPLVICNFTERNDIYDALLNLSLYSRFNQKIIVKDLYTQFYFIEALDAVGLNITYSFFDFYDSFRKKNAAVRVIESVELPSLTIGYLKKHKKTPTKIEDDFIDEINAFFGIQ